MDFKSQHRKIFAQILRSLLLFLITLFWFLSCAFYTEIMVMEIIWQKNILKSAALIRCSAF